MDKTFIRQFYVNLFSAASFFRNCPNVRAIWTWDYTL